MMAQNKKISPMERGDREMTMRLDTCHHHYIKILPQYFIDVDAGIKTFEIRWNDRNYKVGDVLHLQEYCDGEYTGRELIKEICYMIDDPEFCKEGFVVLGIK